MNKVMIIAKNRFTAEGTNYLASNFGGKVPGSDKVAQFASEDSVEDIEAQAAEACPGAILIINPESVSVCAEKKVDSKKEEVNNG